MNQLNYTIGNTTFELYKECSCDVLLKIAEPKTLFYLSILLLVVNALLFLLLSNIHKENRIEDKDFYNIVGFLLVIHAISTIFIFSLLTYML